MDEATRRIIEEAVSAAVEGAYRQLKENGLTTINERLGSVEKALYKVEERVKEIPLLREEIRDFLENHA